MAKLAGLVARGLAGTRNIARPCLATRLNENWWLHDDPISRRTRRNDEWIVLGSFRAEEIDALARARASAGFVVSAIVRGQDETRAALLAYRKLGYRLWRMEPLMARSTRLGLEEEPMPGIQRLNSAVLAEKLGKSAREKPLDPKMYEGDSSPIRCLVYMEKDQVVGWSRSIAVGRSSWCYSVYVHPNFRRRGIGRALVRSNLKADFEAGLSTSFLAARLTGAKLYTAVGYEHCGVVLVLTPKKNRSI